MKYLLQWGESPEFCYENTFESWEQALDWLNNSDIKWNQIGNGHWFEFYERKQLICNSMWEQLTDYHRGLEC